MARSSAIAAIQDSGPMAKAMSVAGMVVGGLVALLFVVDLALAIPFGRASLPSDIGMMLCGAVLAYLGWNAFSETRHG